MKTTRTLPISGKLLPQIQEENEAMCAALDRFEDSMQVPGGSRVLILTLAHGQSRPYGASHYRGQIIAFGGHLNNGTPTLRWLRRSDALVLGKIFISEYSEYAPFLERRLVYCKPMALPPGMPIGWHAQDLANYVENDDGTPDYRAPCWDFYVSEPWND